MNRKFNAPMITGSMLAACFIAISLYLLLYPLPVTMAGKTDLRLYALLIGAYGIWRAIRVYIKWKEALSSDPDE
ncbi:MAG: hypothetical protein WCH05_01990 [Chlorobiaceae bacterium]